MRDEILIIQEMIADTNNGFYTVDFLFDFVEQHFGDKYHYLKYHLDDWLDENNKRITNVDIQLYFVPNDWDNDFWFSIDLLDNGKVELNTSWFTVAKFENVTNFGLTITKEGPPLMRGDKR